MRLVRPIWSFIGRAIWMSLGVGIFCNTITNNAEIVFTTKNKKHEKKLYLLGKKEEDSYSTEYINI